MSEFLFAVLYCGFQTQDHNINPYLDFQTIDLTYNFDTCQPHNHIKLKVHKLLCSCPVVCFLPRNAKTTGSEYHHYLGEVQFY